MRALLIGGKADGKRVTLVEPLPVITAYVPRDMEWLATVEPAEDEMMAQTEEYWQEIVHDGVAIYIAREIEDWLSALIKGYCPLPDPDEDPKAYEAALEKLILARKRKIGWR